MATPAKGGSPANPLWPRIAFDDLIAAYALASDGPDDQAEPGGTQERAGWNVGTGPSPCSASAASVDSAAPATSVGLDGPDDQAEPGGAQTPTGWNVGTGPSPSSGSSAGDGPGRQVGPGGTQERARWKTTTGLGSSNASAAFADSNGQAEPGGTPAPAGWGAATRLSPSNGSATSVESEEGQAATRLSSSGGPAASVGSAAPDMYAGADPSIGRPDPSGGRCAPSGLVSPVSAATPVVRFRARNVLSPNRFTLGSQLLGQAVAAAERAFPGMAVQSMHAVFPRAGDVEAPIDISVETVHSGRALATAQVSFRQSGGEHARALVMLSRDEPDFLRHGATLPDDVAGPDACEPFDCPLVPWETRTEGGDAAWDSTVARPGPVDVWLRAKDAPGDPGASRALLAHASEAFVIPVALRGYPAAALERRGGRGVSVVLAQTVTFHEPFSLRDWILLRAESSYAGRGRMHGRFQAYGPDGRLVASITAEALMRPAHPHAAAAS
ncbi:acyl-CoA thioesterase [Yinghuangia seranimata]|uniref:acyl-CoA thioesterase n=1 Tax=Yinghuangia seranimata TaxID=408067 RepID=UPI00248C912B|nr:acyl-CoA thioesterase domain-containing protein [Yinghuangia seranimata]MDI2129860.1 thioesterase family protein [Yinghuangia seranimata]